LGGDGHNAERIMPEFQDVKVGDEIPLYPNGPDFGVAEVQVPTFLLLRTMDATTGEFTRSLDRDGVVGTWVFYLEPRLDKSTRLIVRARMDFKRTFATRAMWEAVEPVAFVMGRKTLLGIKERAETHRVPDELLDSVMPEYEFRGRESIVIHATPERIFQALKEVTLKEMPLAELLGELRYLPGRLTGRMPAAPTRDQPFMDQVLVNNIVLAEQPERELVIGCIGKLHKVVDQEFVKLSDAAEFRRFLQEDYQKLAMSFRLRGDDPRGGCALDLEYRTHALSEHSRKQFAQYWLAIKPTGGFVSQQLLGAIKRHAERPIKENVQMKEMAQGERRAESEPALVHA
jgi:hypothetical protein